MSALTATETRTVDPFTFEILSHRLHQITREIGITLERVGGTVNTTQMHDYINALYRANGDVLSAGESSGWHVACASFAVKRIIERFQDDEGIEPGDMFLLNDPYVAAIHQSDVYVISPVHYGDRLVAWSATFVHVMDIGAMSPGGNSPGATEICHEGVRIPGIKLIERGRLRRDVFDAICNMTRQPAMVGLDLKCEIAANNVARTRLQEVCAQYGPDLVDAVSTEMIRYSEQVLRNRLLEIPDGRWSATGIIETSENLRVTLTLTKDRDHLLFDFTGTDPQARVGINLPYHATFGACFGAVLALLAWDIPRNHGAYGPIEVVAPPGTITNVQPPGPVSLNTTSGGTVVKFVADAALAQMAAASERWRTEVMGKRVGLRSARHAGVNQYGSYYVASFGGLDGGGARAHSDGVDSGGATLMTDHNVEWFESHYPFLYLFRRHIQDGGGAGKYRGGVGREGALKLHDAPEERIKGVAFGVAGHRNSGRGVFGGYPGAPSVVVVHAGTRVNELLAGKQAVPDLADLGGHATSLSYSDFELQADDVFFISSSSGGGYGDPLARDPAAVEADVLQGLVSVQAARDVYGVVCAGQELDRGATDVLRSRLLEERQEDLARAGRALGAETALPPLPLGEGWGEGVGRAVPSGSAARMDVAPTDHPFRENLEVATFAGVPWVRCAACRHSLRPLGDDWTEACDRKLLPPTNAGPLMEPLVGKFFLEQLYCPSCAALLNTEVVEAEAETVAGATG